MTRSFLLALGLGAALGLSSTAPALSADAKPEPVALVQANVELTTLTTQLKSGKTQNEDLLGSLDAVAKAYHNLVGPDALAADATEEQKKAYEAEKTKFDAAAEKYRKDAEKQFLEAFTLVRMNKKTEQNDREDVNVKAAQILGATKNKDLSSRIITDIDGKLMKAKYQITMGLWEASFAALGTLGDKATLTWLQKTFTHTKNSPPEAVDQLVAAHKSIPLYPLKDDAAIPGKFRFELAKEMIVQYSGTESNAEQSKTDPKKQSAKTFWDRIRTDAIKAVQVLAEEPKNADGQVLATMKEFQDWLRDHNNERMEPWKKKETK